ncbi:hypothetical protein OPV22_030066 [Ensete ventricosum]|uniref:Uncharacterized protein n=1 Tax=Ensete ventricosum TaxID=4639 RepID=A0AAV8QFC6_ENSVE|nr:hypothetical protein OPV22_030066 [Ensete ventricosum]
MVLASTDIFVFQGYEVGTIWLHESDCLRWKLECCLGTKRVLNLIPDMHGHFQVCACVGDDDGLKVSITSDQ